MFISVINMHNLIIMFQIKHNINIKMLINGIKLKLINSINNKTYYK